MTGSIYTTLQTQCNFLHFFGLKALTECQKDPSKLAKNRCPEVIETINLKNFRGAAPNPAGGLTAPPRPPAGFEVSTFKPSQLRHWVISTSKFSHATFSSSYQMDFLFTRELELASAEVNSWTTQRAFISPDYHQHDEAVSCNYCTALSAGGVSGPFAKLWQENTYIWRSVWQFRSNLYLKLHLHHTLESPRSVHNLIK